MKIMELVVVQLTGGEVSNKASNNQKNYFLMIKKACHIYIFFKFSLNYSNKVKCR